MIIVLKQHAPAEQVDSFCHELEDMGYQINDSVGSDTHILGLIGDTKSLAESWVLANPVVETCRRVTPMRATATSCSETPRSRLCGRIPQ